MPTTTLPFRLTRTVAILTTLLILLPTTIIGWYSIAKHDKNVCELSLTIKTDPTKPITTTAIYSSPSPTIYSSKPPPPTEYSIAINQEGGPNRYINSPVKNDLNTLLCQLDTTNNNTFYIRTIPPPPNADGYIIYTKLYTYELANATITHIPPLHISRTVAWKLFTPIYSIITILALLTLGVLTYAQFRT